MKKPYLLKELFVFNVIGTKKVLFIVNLDIRVTNKKVLVIRFLDVSQNGFS